MTVRIDPGTEICECGGEGNEMTVPFGSSIPDPEIVSIEPVCAEDGTRHINVDITNNGCGDLNQDFTVVISDNKGTSRTYKFTELGGTLPLRVGQTQTVTATGWKIDRSVASINYTVTIDPQFEVCDLKRDNNTVTISYSSVEPDLSVDDVKYTQNGDGTITFTVTVSNSGFGPANEAVFKAYDETGKEIYSSTVSLGAGETKDIVFTVGPYDDGNAHQFRFVLDGNESTCESDGENNIKITPVEPGGGKTGKIEVNITCGPGSDPGGLFRFEIVVTNSGDIDLRDVNVMSTLPEGFQYVEGSSVVDGARVGDPAPGVPMVWIIDSLKPGQSVTLVYMAVADADIDPARYCTLADGWGAYGASAPGVEPKKAMADESQCCVTVSRGNGEGCCLRVEEWPTGSYHRPDGPMSFIEPYFNTESAMLTVYASFNLWKDAALEKGKMPRFMRERLVNYARSTMEEFYFGSRLGLFRPDGTLWLSAAGAYPEADEKDAHRWARKQVDQTMTGAQVGFELLALLEAWKSETDETRKGKWQSIIKDKLIFLSFFATDLPHAWEINLDGTKDGDKDGNGASASGSTVPAPSTSPGASAAGIESVEETLRKQVKPVDGEALLYDRAALYLAAVKLEKDGISGASTLAQGLRKALEEIDNKKFNKDYVNEELLFVLALLEKGETEQAKSKVAQFETLYASDKAQRGDSDTAEAGNNDENKEEAGLLNNLYDYALAAAVNKRAGGSLYDELRTRMKRKFYMSDTGIYADRQPDFTHKLQLRSMAALVLAFDGAAEETREAMSTVLYRTFDEVGLFLKKRNLMMGKPLFSLLKNYPFSEPLVPVLPFTKAKKGIVPVFSRDASVHSPQTNPLGEVLVPGDSSKILSPAYETDTARIADVSFGLQLLGGQLLKSAQRSMIEEGRSLTETGKKYIDSLIFSGAGARYDGMLLLPFDGLAVKGPRKGEFDLEPLESGSTFSTASFANYMVAEKQYIENKGKNAEAVSRLMNVQSLLLAEFKSLGYVPAAFDFFMEPVETAETATETEAATSPGPVPAVGPGKLVIIAGQERATRIEIAKLYFSAEDEAVKAFLKSALTDADGTLTPGDLVFLSAVPELATYFEAELKAFTNEKEPGLALSSAGIIAMRLLGEAPDSAAMTNALDGLAKLWDKESVLPKSDHIENIEKGLIYHHDPLQFVLYLTALTDNKPFHFKRTLNLFSYLLENEWGVEWDEANTFMTFPSSEYRIFREEPKERIEPGDLLNIKVRVENECPQGYGSARDLASLYLKATFSPSLFYMGTQPVDNLFVINDFQWRYDGFPTGSVLEYIYQAFVPYEFNHRFIDGSIYVGARQGVGDFDTASASGDNCEDIAHLKRLNIVPLEELQGVVFEDRNVNGIKDVGENGISGILFKDTRGRMFRSNGEGRFTVLAGDHHEGVQMELKSLPAHYLLKDSPTRLVNRNYTGMIYFGLVPCKTVKGFVYQDANGNGEFDNGESRPFGVLIEAKGKTVVSGKDGRFIFRNLPELWQEWMKIKDKQIFFTGEPKNLKFKIDE